YIGSVQPSLTFMMIMLPMAGMLLPILILLFTFSTERSRRHPVFVLNVLTILLGLTSAATNSYLTYMCIVFPSYHIPASTKLVNATILMLAPLFTDSVLLLRVVAFYPRASTPFYVYAAVLSLPLVLKAGRLVAIIGFLISLHANRDGSMNIIFSLHWPRNPWLMGEWSLQVADNVYCTAFFLGKLYCFYQRDGAQFLVRNATLLSRVRAMFVIALSNFVFPLFFSVAQITLTATQRFYEHGVQVMIANMYANILGVLFATVLASGRAWGRHE
ncbi:hypothetical protein FISHEDRAFT_27846, partial [Fistulina hepatica ATCC 64428]